ncbi:MAG: transaldolase family protein [Elainellaceae cyanobacterium]
MPVNPSQINTFRTNALGLRLFLDTADVDQWATWLPTGLFYGITTNPLLLQRAKVACSIEQLKELVDRALAHGVREIHLQTWGDAMAQTGQALAKLSDRVVVKVPLTLSGVEAAAKLSRDVPVTLTAAYYAHQALMGAALNAAYVAPYLGRLTDAGQDGRAVIAAMQRSLTALSSETRLLVASIRQVADLTTLTQQGLNTFTISPAIAQALFSVPLTEKAAADFEAAAQSS